MSKLLRFFLLSFILLGSLASFSAYAATTQVIVTPVPAPKEVIVTPEGYVNCFTVAAGWFKDVWVPEHRVCQYDAAAATTGTVTTKTNIEGVAWVEGYWACTAHKTATGECTAWDWRPGRWVKTFEVY